MINSIFGVKLNQSQRFLSDGTRIPVTEVKVHDLPVVALKNKDKHGYSAIQVRINNRLLREIPADQVDQLPNLGDQLKVTDVLKPGDIVDVVGVSKGKGFAGVVKRHHFKGGPRTHGQSDRERAPGSIGQTTTPGRVYKGKRMAGRMGNAKTTVKNLMVVDVLPQTLFIKGMVPGGRNSIVMIKKVGENKKFVPIYKEKVQEVKKEVKEEKNAS